jgi:two-component system, NarL family, sensor histidine kinase UhpB
MESGRILIVDDEIDLLKPLCDFLSECGYTVKGCTSGKEALDALREQTVDLLLIDLIVPDMDGITILREAFKIAPGILGIIISGKGSVQTAVNAMKAGAFDYILKPPDIEMLRQVLSRAMGVKRLQQAEKKYRSIFENSIGGIFQASPEGQNITANYALARIFGYDSPEELIASLTDTEEHFSAAPWSRPEFIRFMQKNDVVTGFESRVYRKDGNRIWVSVNAISVRDAKGKLLYYEGIIEDITERKRSEEELKRSREQLRYLSAHLESAREKERMYIAREIHDELGQILTTMKMDLRWLCSKINADQRPMLSRIYSITDLVDIAVKTVQRISAELRPRFLDDLGLVAAVEWQIEEFRNHTGIRCELVCTPEDMNPEQDISTALYRILQETLTNIVRHARATLVKVCLKQSAETAILEVRDNGKGITEDQIASPKSYGLTGIRERVYLLGGDIRITGMHERGTTVFVNIPLKRECMVI